MATLIIFLNNPTVCIPMKGIPKNFNYQHSDKQSHTLKSNKKGRTRRHARILKKLFFMKVL